MEDIREWMDEDDARVAPEVLGYRLRGLTAAVNELLQEGPPSDSRERLRYNEMVGTLARLAEAHALVVSRWLAAHMDDCESETRVRR